MPSRSQKAQRELPPVHRRRNTTVAQDVKDSIAGVGRSIGGLAGGAANKIRNRRHQIDKAVDGDY
jgi:hypothetical protein